MSWLLIETPDGHRRQYKLSELDSGFGRAKANAVPLADQKCSSFHCLFRRKRDGSFAVVDAGSRNGTFINDDRLDGGEQRVLGEGDVVAIGQTRIVYSESEPTTACERILNPEEAVAAFAAIAPEADRSAESLQTARPADARDTTVVHTPLTLSTDTAPIEPAHRRESARRAAVPKPVRLAGARSLAALAMVAGGAMVAAFAAGTHFGGKPSNGPAAEAEGLVDDVQLLRTNQAQLFELVSEVHDARHTDAADLLRELHNHLASLSNRVEAVATKVAARNDMDSFGEFRSELAAVRDLLNHWHHVQALEEPVELTEAGSDHASVTAAGDPVD